MSLAVDIRKDGRIAILHLSGNLTIHNVRLMRESIAEQMKEGTDGFCLDLSALDHIERSGLGELIRVYSSVRNEGSHARFWKMLSGLRELSQVVRL